MSPSPATHLSAADLALLNLPGLPTSKRKVNERAAREGWSFVERVGRGGGRLYAIADLPEAARRAFQARVERRVPANLRPVGRPAGTDFFTRHPDVADAVEAILAERSLAAMRVLELLSQRFARLPSRRTLARFIDKLETDKKALLASVRDPDSFKSRYKVALGRADGSVTHAHQVWELDTTKVDVLTKGGRVSVLGVIDRWSRRARFLVAPSESGQSVRRLLIDTIAAWGVMPDAVATDNGSGYINASIASALETLGIRHIRCLPGSPERKPYVERLFGTWTRERAALLPGFAGHNVAQAQQLRGKAKKETGRAVVVPELTGPELQEILTAWTDGTYHQRTHSSIGTSPMRRWLSSPVPARAAPAADVLKIALSRKLGTAVVGKRGIQWKGGRYWAAALVPHMGRPVTIRIDEDDLGALFVFDGEGRFVDTAVNAERAGLSEEAFARAADLHQRAWMKEHRAELRAKQRAFSFEDARDQLLRHEAEAAGKLRYLPTATTRSTTPQLDSIAQAPAPATPSAARLEEAARRSVPTPRPAELNVAERVAAADRVIDAADRGAPVDPDELRRARLFATTTAYRAEKIVGGHFGASNPVHHDVRRQSA
jgi:transposase InsO family protein